MPSKTKDELERDFYLRSAGGKRAYAAVITSTTNVITPAANNYIEVSWVYALTDPDAVQSPLLTVAIGAKPIYVGYAISHTEVFVGAVGESVTITLSESADVAVTIHYRELR